MIAAVVVWAILTLMALAICSDSAQRDLAHARRQHPSNGGQVEDVVIVPLICAHCDWEIYQIPTDGHDLLIVAMATVCEWESALNWHLENECRRVAA